MLLIVTFIVFGFVVALPVGPVTIEMIRVNMRSGFLSAWMIGIGGMVIDVGMILLIYFGLSTVFELDAVQTTMWFIGGAFLLHLGVQSIREDSMTLEQTSGTRDGRFQSFLKGVVLALTPGNLMFWIGVFGTVLAAALQESGFGQFLVIGVSILGGILLHDLLLLTVVSIVKRKINGKWFKAISIIAGVLLLVFAAYFLLSGVRNIIEL